MPITLEIREQWRLLVAAGKASDELIGVMRVSGLTKMECLKMLVELGLATPSEAKHLVHKSSVWKDAFLRDEKLHGALRRAVQTGLNKL